MQIPNFDNYFVSRDGKILSKVGNMQPHIVKPISTNQGYQYVFLYNGNGKRKKMFVHRAVLMAWVGMPKKGQETRHLNDTPTDNRVENLAWGSRMENVADKIRNGRLPIGEKAKSHKLTESQVVEIREKYKIGLSSRDLSTEYGVSHTTILKITRGQRWKHISDKPILVKHSTIRKDYKKQTIN